jgi:hypothetical protein
MTQKKYRVTGKDRLSDPYVSQDFDSAEEAQAWADQRAFVLASLSTGKAVIEMEVSDR